MAFGKTFRDLNLQPRGAFLALTLALIGGVAVETRQNSALEIATRDGKISAQLTLPQVTTGKVPVVVFVTAGDDMSLGGARSFANVLANDGIASLRYSRRSPAVKEGDAGFESEVADAAAIVSFLRNDARFSTITVAGDESGSAVASVAGRVARADNAVTFTWLDTPVVTKAVRDLDLPGAPKPRRNTGQRASLRDTTIATIDGARIAIEYGRPSKRGRVIWGNLVKWGGWWMPGADEATTLTTTRALQFGSVAVPVGDYTLYTQPGENEFVLIVNRQTGQFHTVYNPDQDLGRVAMTRETVDPFSERMTFALEPRAGGGGVLKLIWDDRAYVTPFSVSKP
jgi:hypothetical protein